MSSEFLCLFCSNVADSDEHVFPDWYNKQIRVGRGSGVGVLRRWSGIGAPLSQYRMRKGKLTSTTLCVVCRQCNNGWMSQIEETASLIYKQLIRGESIEISYADKKVIATWISLKMIVCDAERRDKQVIPREVSLLFAENHVPLTNSTFYLGRYLGTFNKPGRHVRDLRHILYPNSERSTICSEIFSAQTLLFVIDNVVLYGVWRQISRIEFSLDPFVEGFIPEIWPNSTETYHWPRPHVGDEIINYLSLALWNRYPDIAFKQLFYEQRSN